MEKEVILTIKQLFEVLEDLPDGIMLIVSWEDRNGESE